MSFAVLIVTGWVIASVITAIAIVRARDGLNHEWPTFDLVDAEQDDARGARFDQRCAHVNETQCTLLADHPSDDHLAANNTRWVTAIPKQRTTRGGA